MTLRLSVAPPGVFRPSSLLLPLGVPSPGLACGIGCQFSQGVADPSPLPSQVLFLYWLLSPSQPEVLVLDFVWPSDPKDVLQTAVDEGLDLLQCLFSHSPRL